jgi:antitoxin component YwqK of YwqJK toxin-antitoxin module
MWGAGALILGCGTQPVPSGSTYWPDGSPREEWARVVPAEGDTVRHGAYRSWYESGVLRELGEFEHGKRSGSWTRWYDATPAAKLWEGNYVSDLKEGRWTFWRDPSHVHDGTSTHDHSDSQAHHSTTATSPDSAPLKHEHYRSGVAHGVWISWYMNGQTADSMMYEAGQLEGHWRSYHPNGTRQSESTYLHGSLQNSILMWDSLGTPLTSR